MVRNQRSPFRFLRWLWLPEGADWKLSLAVVMLAGTGLVLLTSTRQGSSAGFFLNYGQDVLRQLAYLFAAYVLMVLFSRMFSYPLWHWIGGAVNLLYLAVMFYTAFWGLEINGSSAWLRLGKMTMQPSEFGKPLSILLLASSLDHSGRQARGTGGFWRLFRWPLLFMLANSTALILQRDIGSLVIFLGINTICLLVPAYQGIRKGQAALLAAMLCGCIGIGALVSNEQLAAAVAQIPGAAHILTRIENMKDPYQDLQGAGYQPANALYGIGEAGLTGKGLGNSIRKYGYLSQEDSDYIFAIVVEETGLFGILWVFGWYCLLWWELLRYAMKARTVSNQMVLVGTALYFLLHFVINIGGVGALIPMTGVPLLLFSSGGSALAACAIAIGVSQNRIADIVGQERCQDEKRQREQSAAPSGHAFLASR